MEWKSKNELNAREIFINLTCIGRHNPNTTMSDSARPDKKTLVELRNFLELKTPLTIKALPVKSKIK